MEHRLVWGLISTGFVIGFVAGQDYAIERFKRRGYTKKDSLQDLYLDYLEYAAKASADDTITVEEYVQTLKEKEQFIDIVKAL